MIIYDKDFILIMRRFNAALLPRLFENSIPGHTTRAPPAGFELATKGIHLPPLITARGGQTWGTWRKK